MHASLLLALFVAAAFASEGPVSGTIPLTFLPLNTGAACLDGSPYGAFDRERFGSFCFGLGT
jgi:hypothetical protein